MTNYLYSDLTGADQPRIRRIYEPTHDPTRR